MLIFSIKTLDFNNVAKTDLLKNESEGNSSLSGCYDKAIFSQFGH